MGGWKRETEKEKNRIGAHKKVRTRGKKKGGGGLLVVVSRVFKMPTDWRMVRTRSLELNVRIPMAVPGTLRMACIARDDCTERYGKSKMK